MRCLLLCLLAVPVFAKEKPLLPVEWHGTWSGTLVITNASDKRSEVPVSLKIEPKKDTRELTWAITYGDGPKASLRDYKLVPHGDSPTRLRIDEQNGIVLDARFVGNVLYSHFEVGGSLLTARYERVGEVLRLEITSAKKAPEKTGKGSVQGYTVEAVQVAELKKK